MPARTITAAGVRRTLPSRRGSSGSRRIPPFVRGGDNYTSAIAVADRGPLHLEARYNYESRGCALGVRRLDVFRRRHRHMGVDAAAGRSMADRACVRARRWRRASAGVSSTSTSKANTSTITTNTPAVTGTRGASWDFEPVEWLRIGVVGQRTRAYGGDRDIQRGPFAQLTWRRITIGGYWFNPGSSEQVFVASDRRDVLSATGRWIATEPS